MTIDWANFTPIAHWRVGHYWAQLQLSYGSGMAVLLVLVASWGDCYRQNVGIIMPGGLLSSSA